MPSILEIEATGPHALHRLEASALTVHAQPVVVRGLCRDWPLVVTANRSAGDFARALAALDTGVAVDVLELAAETDGVVGYNAAMDGFNYRHFKLPVREALMGLAARNQRTPPVGVALQSALIADCIPGFLQDHPMPCLPASWAQPRLWLGNRVTTPAHFDASHNLAVVACGRRRFTLFPIEQIDNLYIGPLDFAPTLSAMTVARLNPPDLQRFPRLATALRHAMTVELCPGDALYMPPLWWHQVESLEPLNALVNYWWTPPQAAAPAPMSGLGALSHAALALRQLPAAERAAWRVLFEHYVFADADPVAHLPLDRRGMLGTLEADALEQARARIRRML
ncbi:MAG: cupin-like domain-containing protein [Pseudoxanthomonas sp.]